MKKVTKKAIENASAITAISAANCFANAKSRMTERKENAEREKTLAIITTKTSKAANDNYKKHLVKNAKKADIACLNSIVRYNNEKHTTTFKSAISNPTTALLETLRPVENRDGLYYWKRVNLRKDDFPSADSWIVYSGSTKKRGLCDDLVIALVDALNADTTNMDMARGNVRRELTRIARFFSDKLAMPEFNIKSKDVDYLLKHSAQVKLARFNGKLKSQVKSDSGIRLLIEDIFRCKVMSEALPTTTFSNSTSTKLAKQSECKTATTATTKIA